MLASRLATAVEIARTQLSHTVYVPENLTVASPPVVVMVHGRSGDSRAMWVFSKALEESKPVVVAPQSPYRDPKGGFTWWPVPNVAHGESMMAKETRYVDMIAPLGLLGRFVDSLPLTYGTNPRRVFGIGFSQGAALLASLSLLRPQLFQGVAILSGYLPFDVLTQLKGDNTSDTKYFISHGTEDEVIPFEQAESARVNIEALGRDVLFHKDSVGHKVSSEGIKALSQWMSVSIGR